MPPIDTTDPEHNTYAPAKVRGKFYVYEKTEIIGGGRRILLQAVTRGKDNAEWAHYTPVGKIEMTVSADAVGAQALLTVGDEFYVDFTPAPKGQEG